MSLFKPGTKRYVIASLHAAGLSVREAYSELRPKVAEQVKPWVFTTNSPSGRIPKPLGEQYVELQHEINRVYSLIERSGNDVPPKVDEPPKQEKPRKKSATRDDEKQWFVDEWVRLRKFIRDTSERTGALPIDSLDSMRPIQAAKACIDAGISAATLVYAMCLHWPQASREMAQVATADFIAESENLGDSIHKLTGYVLKLANACRSAATDQKFGIMLIGPAGSGKSRLARQVASMIQTEAHPNGLPYAECPMTQGATRGDLLGRITLEGFIPSKFVEIYSGGGVFNFEEIDAAEAGMLIVLNNALASGELYNSVNGEVYKMHPDFIPMATANTFGFGANVQYTGREKLDLATIDRFRMGRVLVDLDENLARHLMFA